MKQVFLVCEGMADEALLDLSGRTPLEVAKKPNMDALAKRGRQGMASFTPHKLSASADVACLSILGYDPEEYYTGLAPLEARAMGLNLSDREIAFRCDFVTVFDEVLVDMSAGGISQRESQILISELNEKIGSDRVRVCEGEGYKNILIVSDAEIADALDETECVSPASLVGQKFTKHLPDGPGAAILGNLIDRSKSILAAHEVNRVRIDLGENPANMIWLWGQGKTPKIPLFLDRRGTPGAFVSKSFFARGLAQCAGLKICKDLSDAVECGDFVFIYFEASEPRDSAKKLQQKIRKIEEFDSSVVGPAIRMLEKSGPYKICITTDCAESLSKSTPTHGRVPFLMAGEGFSSDASGNFDEKSASHTRLVMEEGYRLMEYFQKAG